MRRAIVWTLVVLAVASITARGQTARTAAPLTNTFNVLAYGAKPDAATDNAPPIQRAIDAAQEATGYFGGSVVYIPGGPKPYFLSGPLLVKGHGVTVRGDGVGSMLEAAPGYAGPLLCVGLPAHRGTIGAAHRPDGFGVLDRSAAPARGARRGLATLGKAGVVFQGHPLQLGGPDARYNFNPPDYWVGSRRLTVEFLLTRPPGATWSQAEPLFGMAEALEPSPWHVMAGDTQDKVWLLFKTNERDLQGAWGFYRVVIPISAGPGAWRVTVQLDLEAGREATWVNRRRAASRVEWNGDPGRGFRPGLAFQPQDGATPFMVGWSGKHGPSDKGRVTPMGLFGLRVSKAALYAWDGATEVATAAPGKPVRDLERYFTVTPDTVALLALDDPPGPPTIKTLHPLGAAVGFWVPHDRPRDTHHVTVRDLQFRARIMAGLVVGEHLGLRLERLDAAGGLQGITTLPLATSYPMTMNDCTVGGTDCGYFGYWQNLSSHNLMVSGFGRQGIRFRSGYCLWDHTFLGDFAPNTESAVQVLGDASGTTHEFRRLQVDNESGGPGRAIIELEQGYSSSQNRLVIDGLDCSIGNKQAVILRLTGHGADPKQSWYKAKLDARNVTCHDQKYRAAVELVGPPSWHGTFDGSALERADVVGPGADKITVIPPARFP